MWQIREFLRVYVCTVDRAQWQVETAHAQEFLAQQRYIPPFDAEYQMGGGGGRGRGRGRGRGGGRGRGWHY